MRTGAAEARQLRQHVLTASGARLRLPRDEAVRRLAPGPIGSAAVRREQIADAVLAHHGLVAVPRLERSQPGESVDISISRVLAGQGAVAVALAMGTVGFVLRPIYGFVLFAAGMAAAGMLWQGRGAFERLVPEWIPRGRLLGVAISGVAVAIAFFGVVLPLRSHYQRIGAPPGVLVGHALLAR